MSWACVRAVAGLELRTLLRGPLWWAMVALVLAFTMAVDNTVVIRAGGTGMPGGTVPIVNSAHAIAFAFAMIGFFTYGFFASIMAGMAVIRDDERGVSELLHATPLSGRAYLTGKLAGVTAAMAIAIAVHTAFAILFFELGPLGDGVARGPFRLGHYALPALVLLVPMVWLFATLAFALGERSRQPMAVFALPTALFLAIAFVFIPRAPAWMPPAVDRLLTAIDPSGLRWLLHEVFAVDRDVAFYDAAPLAFPAAFLLGRLALVVLPLLAVAASVAGVRARSVGDRAGKRRRGRGRARARREPATSSPPAAGAGRLAELGMRARAPGAVSGALAVARAELGTLRGQPALLVLVLLIALLVAEGAATALGPLGAPRIPTAGDIATGSLGLLAFLGCLVLLFFTVESLYRETRTGFAPLLYAAPLGTGALLAGKLIAAAALGGAIVLGAGVAGVGVLATSPQARLELLPFVWVWGLLLMPTYLLWSAFVAAVYALVRHRYATYALGLGALAASAYHLGRASMSWLFNWTLAGAVRWSDFGIWPLDGRALLLNRALALTLAIFMAALAIGLFPRVERDVARRRREWSQWRTPRPLLRAALRLAPLALPPLILAAVLAAGIEAGTRGAVEPDAIEPAETARAETAHADILHADIELALEPARREVAVRGRFTLVNRNGAALRALTFTVPSWAEDIAWTVEGTAVDDGDPRADDDRTDRRTLTPPAALAPAGQTRVGFAYRGRVPPGPTRNGGGVEQFVLDAGVVLHTLRDPFLPMPAPAAGDAATPAPFDARLTITAPGALTVSSVGVQIAETVPGSDALSSPGARTTTVWQTDRPVRALNVVASARWTQRRRGATAVFHHPDHDANVETILDAAVAARERYGRWFAPYPWRELRIVEVPELAPNAQGFPTHVTLSESYGFLTENDDTEPVFLLVAHEVAHQWWGNLVAAAEGPGTAHLVEGMAHYSALLLHGAELGPRARIALAERMEASYLEKRNAARERPLAEMVDDRRPADWTVVYEKGAWAMWMLHCHLGDERALAGLRAFVARYRDRADDLPTTEDLLATLRRYATDEQAYRAFVAQWFFDVVLPEVRIHEAAAEPTGDGTWQVTATVENVGTGTVDVELAAARGERFPGDARAPSPAYADARATVTLAPGVPRRVRWTAPFEPERLVADPDAVLLQRGRARARVSL